MLGVLSEQEIESLLRNQYVGRIGCHSDNKIYVVPITYVYKDGYIYGHSHEGKKILMMRKDPRICFEVDAIEDLAHWQSVIVWGEYEEIETEEGKLNVFKILSDRTAGKEASETMTPSYRMPSPHPYNVEVKDIAFRIRIHEKTGRFEQKY